ncbi:MAG: thymidylate kinase [Methanobrevibacter sp.]|nr:thymidylate kinase [Methanobrevibacter sp.]
MKFIVIDGIDGSGKDTQVQFIYEKYMDENNSFQTDNVISLRSHPESDNNFGKICHNALSKKGKLRKLIAGIFYVLDIVRSLILYYPKSDILIFSRYLLGVMYIPKPLVKLSYIFLDFIFPTSNYMFFLDISPKEAMKRILKRNNYEFTNLHAFENEKSLGECRKKAFLVTKNWKKVNGEQNKDKVWERIEYILNTT